MSPLLYNVSLQNWQYFVTLTYRSKDDKGQPLRVPDEVGRRKMLFAFLRGVAAGRKKNSEGRCIDQVHFSKLLWFVREETGEVGKRYHFHILISGLPLGRMNQSERWVIKSIWTQLGGGHSDVRIFDTRLPGVDYVLKGLDQWSRKNANAYELGKFVDDGADRELILAHACLKEWGQGCTKPRASGGARIPENSELPSSGRRKMASKRTKESPAYEGGLFITNSHPAGVSFVR